MSKNDGPAASSFLASSKTGWLTKHGGSGIKGNWKRRWFVLDHHYLFYYESAKDKHPKGIICLPDYKDCRRAEKAECQKKHSFILIPDLDLVEPGTIPRTYYIHGESEDECNNWVDAILEEMRPTVGIQKQKDRAQSLPEHSKTKISSSVKLNKKDLDVVATAAATGGPQLTHLTKDRAQAPKKRRPPRKFKPMDEDDDPSVISALTTLEDSQLQPSPSKKPATDDKSVSQLASPSKGLSNGSSPKISGKKPVLPPPSNSKLKLDVTGTINKEQASTSPKVKGNPPAPPPKVYKDTDHGAVGEVKDQTNPPVKEAKGETMDTTDSSLPVPTTPSGTAPSTKPKPLREDENKPKPKEAKMDTTDSSLPVLPSTTPSGTAPSTKPKPLREDENKPKPKEAKMDTTDSSLPVLPSTTPSGTAPSTKPLREDENKPNPKEAKGETMDTTDGSLPALPLTTSSGTAPSTKPREDENESVVDTTNNSSPNTPVTPTSNVPLIKPKPLKEEDKLTDDTRNGLSTPPATPTSSVVMPTGDVSKPEPLKESSQKPVETIDTDVCPSSTNDHPVTKPKPSGAEEPVESSSSDIITNGNASSLSTTSTDSEPPSKPKSPDPVENSIAVPLASTTMPTTATRPFAKPKPPAKLPRPPRSTPSKDRNLGVIVDESKDKVSNEIVDAEKIDKPTDNLSDKSAREGKAVKDHVEPVTKDSATKEPTEKVAVKDTAAAGVGKEKEEVVMRKATAVPDNKEKVVPRPKPKPRTSKVDPDKPSPVRISIGETIKENVVAANGNEKIDQKSDAEAAKKVDNGASLSPVESKVDKVSEMVESQVINEDKQVDTAVVSNGNKSFTIEDDDTDALYSVVDLNRSSEEREATRSSREMTPRLHHDYDTVAISPRSGSKTPEQDEDPGYDVIGEAVKEEPISSKELIYDNWKLKKHRETSPGKAKDVTDGGSGYAVVDHEAQNHSVTDVPPSTVPQYAQVRKSIKTKDPAGSSAGTIDDDHDFDALCERIGSSIPGNLDQAQELLRLAYEARQEAKQLKKEAAEDREAARKERMEAEQLKKNATEIFEAAKEKAAS